MGRYLVASDLHISDQVTQGRSRLQDGVRLLLEVFRTAKRERCFEVILAGDVVHQKNRFALSTWLAVQEALRLTGMRVWWLRGNHETPTPSDILNTPIRLMSAPHVETVLGRYVVDADPAADCVLAFLPWFEGEDYLLELAHLKEEVRPYKKRILISHIGVQGGVVSGSNFSPASRVTLKDLNPSFWTFVLLGDYHKHQKLAPNVMYLGAPVSHCFGDDHHGFVWVLDTDAMTVKKAMLGETFPQFFTAGVFTDEDRDYWVERAKFEEQGRDYLRFVAPVEYHAPLQRAWPKAKVVSPSDTVVEIEEDESRLSLDEKTSFETLVARYVKHKGIPKEHQGRLSGMMLEEIHSYLKGAE